MTEQPNQNVRRCNLGRLGYTPVPLLPDDHFAYWLEYARLIGDHLGLAHVKVTLYHTPANPSADAQSKHGPDYNWYGLWLAGDWEYNPPEEQRENIVHEWLHYVVGHVTRPFRALEHPVGLLMWEPTKAAANDAEEQMVDILARWISVHMPLPNPPWGNVTQTYEGGGYQDQRPPDATGGEHWQHPYDAPGADPVSTD